MIHQVGHAVSVQPKLPQQFWDAFPMWRMCRLDQMATEALVEWLMAVNRFEMVFTYRVCIVHIVANRKSLNHFFLIATG
jgi:hypothetical protein